MTIIVCPLSRVLAMVEAHRPGRIVSLLDPLTPFPETGYRERHLRVSMHDIAAPSEGWTAPGAEHIDALLRFVADWDRAGPLLIHCYAGISRSSASAYIAACAGNPRADEMEIAAALRRASLNARPNGRMIELADAALDRAGRMRRAIEETGRDLPFLEIIENEPFSMPSAFGAPR